MPDTVPPISLSERLTGLITGLRGAIGRYVDEHREIWRFTDEVVKLLLRRRNRFAALYARFLAGTLPLPRAPRPHAARPAPAKPSAPSQSREDDVPADPMRMPRRRAWLTAMMGWRVAHYCNDGPLKTFLCDPEMAVFLAAAPQAGRLLRPIWWMVSTHPLPEVLRLPPRARVRRARPKRGPAPSRDASTAPRTESPRTVWPGSGSCLERPRTASTPTPRGRSESKSLSTSQSKSGPLFRG